MFSANRFAKKFSESIRFPFGIIILLMCALTVFFSGPGQTYFISVFIDHYIADFGWSRSLVSSLYSAATLLAGLLLTLIGRLSDRYGSRVITLIAALLLGITSYFSSMLISPVMLFILFFMARLSGQGTMTLMPSTIIPRWFNRRRALAFSLMSLGSVAGSAMLPPLNQFLINSFGWRTTWRFWAFAIWFLFIPLIYLFLYNDPKQLDLKQSANQSDAAAPVKRNQAVKFDTTSNWSLKDAMRTFTFWGLIIIQMLHPMLATGIIFHFVSIMTNRGIESTRAPFLISLIALTGLPATLLAGTILNKLKTKAGGIFLSLFLSSSVFCLVFVQNLTSAMIFAVLLGIAQGFQVVWNGLVWPEYFGMKYLGSLRGFAMSASVIASSMGPLLFGAVYDMTRSYTPVLIASVALTLSGLVISIILKQPKPITYKNEFDP